MQTRHGAENGANHALALERTALIDQATLILFLATVAVFIVTPGPNMIFCVARAIAGGPTAGIYSAIGVCVGLTVHATAAGLGLSQLFKYFPVAYDMLKIGGAIYLLWLAWLSYKASRSATAGAMELNQKVVSGRKTAFSLAAQGTLNAILSPKAVFFYLILFPQFLDPAQGSLLGQSLLLIGIINAINFTVIAGLCLAAGRSSQWLARNPRFLAWQQKIVSMVFVGLAARVALSKSPG